MDLRRFLIAPHERVQTQPAHYSSSDGYADSDHSQHEHQQLQKWQTQQSQHENHGSQHHHQQQPQCLDNSMHQLHNHSGNDPSTGEQHNQLQYQHQFQNPAISPPTRDQVLKGLAAYPDILASILSPQMRDGDVRSVAGTQSQKLSQSHGQRRDENRNEGLKYRSSHARSGLLGSAEASSYYTSARKDSFGRVNSAQKHQSKQEWERRSENRASPTMSKTTMPMIPTSPRAGRYAKGQRLPRQKHRRRQTFARGQRYRSPAQGQEYYSLTGNAGGLTPVPASFTLKRKATGSSTSSKPNTLNSATSSYLASASTAGAHADTDTYAPSSPNKRVITSSMMNAQGFFGGASEMLGKSTGSFRSCAGSMQGMNEEFEKDFDKKSARNVEEDSNKESGKHNPNDQAVEDSVKDSIKDLIEEAKPTDLTEHSNNRSKLTEDSKTKATDKKTLTKSTKAAKQTRQTQRQAQRKALAAAKTFDIIPYTTCLQTNHHNSIKASDLHNKIHATCFLWYHDRCPKKKAKYCEFLHAMTEPPSYVQPPRGYIHCGNGVDGGEVKCTLDWCPGNWMWDHDYDCEQSEEEEAEGEEEEINDGGGKWMRTKKA